MFQRPVRQWAQVLSVTGAMALSVTCGAAQASETVYRCGSSYQAEPCPGGHAVVVADTRDEAARREAQRVARGDEQAARLLRAERLTREQAATQSALTGPAVVVHRAVVETHRPSPEAPASSDTMCLRKSGLRSPAVGGCREERLYVAPGGNDPKVKKTRAKHPAAATGER